MRYIDEINQFHMWLQTNSIPVSARILWYSLMHYCNSCGWRKEFNVSLSVIEVDTGLKRNAIIRARNILKETGRINYISRKGRQSAVYSIIPFVSLKQTQSETQSGAQHGAQSSAQSGAIPRVEKSRVEENAAAARARDTGFGNVAKCYQDNIHPFTGPIESDKLQDLYAQYGEKWLLAGIEECATGNGRSLNYLSAVLARWEKEGFRSPRRKQETMEDTLERARNAIGDFSDEITEEQLKNMLEVE